MEKSKSDKLNEENKVLCLKTFNPNGFFRQLYTKFKIHIKVNG